jgi:hypothetical protein
MAAKNFWNGGALKRAAVQGKGTSIKEQGLTWPHRETATTTRNPQMK